MSSSADWPALPLSEWEPTRASLLLWTQVAGKICLARTPLLNHWWNVPLYVTARGLTTSLIPHDDRGFQIDFNFVDHRVDIAVTDGTSRSLTLAPMTVADFHTAVMKMLDELALSTPIWTMPVEIPDAIPFDEDREHDAYDPEHAQRFWLALVQMNRVLDQFRARFVGKTSPVHLFWGGLDLAATRFSGRTYREMPVSDGARYDTELGEFLLPYETVRAAKDPDAVLLDFLQSTYAAAAERANWDRPALERPLQADTSSR